MKPQRSARAGYLFLALLMPLALTGGRPALPIPAAGTEKAASLPAGSYWHPRPHPTPPVGWSAG